MRGFSERKGAGEDNEGWEVEEKARELFLKKRKEFRKEAWNDGRN